MDILKKLLLLLVGLGFVGSVVAQQSILAVSPNTAAAGDSGVLVQITLPGTTPPTPLTNANILDCRIGTNTGASVTRVDLETVTALFNFAADATSGTEDVLITFQTPQGSLDFTSAGGFAITGGIPPPPPVVVTNNQPMATTYPIVDTAQVDFYDDSASIHSPSNGEAFFGQDGTYVGRQMDYTVSGDGLTVLDNVTGLTWTQSHDWNDDGLLDSNDKMT